MEAGHIDATGAGYTDALIAGRAGGSTCGIACGGCLSG